MTPSSMLRPPLDLALVALLGATACTGVRPLGTTGVPDRSLPIEVAVEEVPAEDAWRVGYVLPVEVAGVELPEGGEPYRAGRWGVGVGEGEVAWHDDDGRERVCFSRPVRAFSAGFRTWAGPPGDRPLTVALDDGGRLLSTGHLRVRPLARCDAQGAEPLPAAPEHRFTFATVEGRAVRVAGETGSTGLREPEAGDGAASLYVAFEDAASDLEAIEDESATLLLDPDVPGWLREQAATDLPRILDRFAGVLDTPLPARPLVRLAWGGGEEAGSGRSAAGSALPGVLRVTVEGAGWIEPSEAARRDAFRALARNAFLLWARGHFPVAPRSAWIAEAAADRFALDAALAFGIESEAVADATRRGPIESANDCLVRLGGRSLRHAAAAGNGAGRACGAVALDVAAGALRRAEPPSDLAHLFRRLFEHATVIGRYGDAPFVAGLRELGADPDAIDDLRRFIVSGREARAELFLQRLLARAGIETVPVPPEEAVAAAETVAEAARRAVGRCWCGAEGPFESESGCDPVATGAGVGSVAGTPLADDPGAAWSHLTAAARGGALTVTLDGLETTLFCGPELLDPTWGALLAPAR